MRNAAYVRGMVEVLNAKFHIGQLVQHRLLQHRGVIAEVDSNFDAPDDWHSCRVVSWSESLQQSNSLDQFATSHLLGDTGSGLGYIAAVLGYGGTGFAAHPTHVGY